MTDISSQGLSSEGIRRHLRGAAGRLSVRVFDCVDSTNSLARQLAVEGAPEGLVIAASSQTAGRGRKGRSFFSPDGTGIYMSLLLRPALSADRALRVTTVAAVSVCQAIEALTGRQPGIKWVNDILMDGRKVCGILTETALSSAAGGLDFVVLGIGINALEPQCGFPEEIKDIAGSVFAAGEGDRRSELAAEVLNRFMDNYAHIASDSLAGEYRRRCVVPGNRVLVLKPEGAREAAALDVDDECRLLVRYDDGSEELLYSGEISIKLNQ